jgi:hypothetical protein
MNSNRVSRLKQISCQLFWVVLKIAVLAVAVTLMSPARSGLLLPLRCRLRLI